MSDTLNSAEPLEITELSAEDAADLIKAIADVEREESDSATED